MLGLPGTLGAVGGALLLAGLAAAAVGAWLLRGRIAAASRLDGVPAAALACTLAVAVGTLPFFAWRVAKAIDFTAGLDANYRDGAGPIQAFVQPYLLDGVKPLLPRDATYYAVASPSLRKAQRDAFGPLALLTFFPRISVARPGDADWIVTWGVDPRTLGTPLRSSRVVRPAQGPFPAVYLARVA